MTSGKADPSGRGTGQAFLDVEVHHSSLAVMVVASRILASAF
jgi:hypothetical protein